MVRGYLWLVISVHKPHQLPGMCRCKGEWREGEDYTGMYTKTLNVPPEIGNSYDRSIVVKMIILQCIMTTKMVKESWKDQVVLLRTKMVPFFCDLVLESLTGWRFFCKEVNIHGRSLHCQHFNCSFHIVACWQTWKSMCFITPPCHWFFSNKSTSKIILFVTWRNSTTSLTPVKE